MMGSKKKHSMHPRPGLPQGVLDSDPYLCDSIKYKAFSDEVVCKTRLARIWEVNEQSEINFHQLERETNLKSRH